MKISSIKVPIDATCIFINFVKNTKFHVSKLGFPLKIMIKNSTFGIQNTIKQNLHYEINSPDLI
jgi:hypothetical protein